MANERLQVSIVDINIGWFDLIALLIQIALCAVPAAIIATLIFLMVGAAFGGWAALMLGAAP